LREYASVASDARDGIAGSAQWLELHRIRYHPKHSFGQQFHPGRISAISTAISMGVSGHTLLAQIRWACNPVIATIQKGCNPSVPMALLSGQNKKGLYMVHRRLEYLLPAHGSIVEDLLVRGRDKPS